MIKRTLILLAALMALGLLLIPGAAQAADFTCSVPNANRAKVTSLCEELRVELRVRKSEWTDDACASYIFRRGMVEVERKRAARLARNTTRSVVRDAVVNFTKTWPKPAAVVCGDGIVDREFGEVCDDGNPNNGDGCSSACTLE